MLELAHGLALMGQKLRFLHESRYAVVLEDMDYVLLFVKPCDCHLELLVLFLAPFAALRSASAAIDKATTEYA